MTPHNAQPPQKMSAFEQANANDPALIAYKKIFSGSVNIGGFLGFKRGYDAAKAEPDSHPAPAATATPETDAAIKMHSVHMEDGRLWLTDAFADFARRLERERDDARRELETLKQKFSQP